MNSEISEIRDMQNFLGIQEKPHTIFKRTEGGDPRGACSYETWLTSYKTNLRRACEAKLAKEFMDNLGQRLFAEKFHHFQEFDIH
jgi:hypothetical protein